MRLNALFRLQQARMKIMIGHRIITIADSLNEVIVILIQAVKQVVLKFFQMKWLPNRCNGIRKIFDLVVLGSSSRIQLLNLGKLNTDLRRASRGMSGKTTLDDIPSFSRGLGEHDHGAHLQHR
jgi:hypothetical protein